MPTGSKPGLLQKSLSSIAVVASMISAGSWSKVDELALELAEPGQLDLAGPVVDDRLLLELDVRRARRGVGQARGVVVVGADGERPRRRPRGGPSEEDDEEDGEDRADGGSASVLAGDA